jgi:signal peptidase I
LPSYRRQQVLEAVERASTRAAVAVHGNLKRGINSLATIAATAPLLGFVLTLFGILNSFGSYGSSKSTIMAATAGGLSESMAPAGLGLAVGILAVWFYRYLSGQVDSFDLEMKGASVDLMNRLVVHLGRIGPATGPARSPAAVPVERRRRDVAREVSSELPLEGPRLGMAWWDDRHGVYDLLWPRLRSDLDADSVLYGGMLVSFAYAFIGWLTCYWQGGPNAGLVTLAFFAAAGLAIRTGSRYAFLCVFAFFAFACAACVIAYGWSFQSTCLAVAPLLLLGSFRAASFLAAAGTPGTLTVTTCRQGFPKSLWPVLRQLPRIFVGPLFCCECAIVLFGTVLTFYSVDTGLLMGPDIHEEDWMVSVNAPLVGAIHRGDFVAFPVEWYGVMATARVVGFPGDRIQVKSGRLIRNGHYVDEPYLRQPYRGRYGNFPIASGDLPYEFRWQHEYAYGRSLKAGEPFVVPQRAYFVLNDNRNELMDSRILGPLRQTLVFGRPVLAYSAVRSPWSWPRLIR